MEQLFEMIFKRKSFRRFDDKLLISKSELKEITRQLENIEPLVSDIRTEFRIVEKSLTTCKRGQYCLLMYSEQKEHSLLNVGYMLEQMDLFLASRNIGVCWYGFGKPSEMQLHGLDFIIMLAFGKSNSENFRKDVSKCKRKSQEIIWNGNFNSDVVNVVRYAPSSCNMQPWRVTSIQDKIEIFRTAQVNSIMPISKCPFYNTIDVGIFLCFLEILLSHYNYLPHDG